MRLAIVLMLLMLAVDGLATPVQVGTTTIETPVPKGFARAVPEMKKLLAVQNSHVPSTNVSLALFIPEEVVPGALVGKFPKIGRRFSIQTHKDLVNRQMGDAEWAALKNTIRTQNEKIYAELSRAMPAHMARISNDVSAQLDSSIVMKAGGMIPLAVHYEDANSIASSTVMSIETNEGGVSDTSVFTGSTTIARVNGRVLFLYVYGREDDLEWTRQAAKAWTKAIMDANKKP